MQASYEQNNILNDRFLSMLLNLLNPFHLLYFQGASPLLGIDFSYEKGLRFAESDFDKDLPGASLY